MNEEKNLEPGKKQWYSLVVPIIVLLIFYIPSGLVWMILTGMMFDVPGSDRILSNWVIFFILNGGPLLIVLFIIRWVYKKWKM